MKPAPPGLLDSPARNFSASVVVFLVALPLCMGIAIASGVPVSAGLVTGIVGGIIVGFLAGAPLQVSGPAAGLTVIVYDIVVNHGIETLGLCVLVGGVLQIICGALGLGVWFRAVSPAVIRGMLTGIGVLIFASQMHVLVDDVPPGGGLKNLVTIPEAVSKGLPWPKLRSESERSAKVDLLKASGALHERQEILRERVAEHVPTDFAPVLGDENDPATIVIVEGLAEDAEALAATQAEIVEQLDGVREAFVAAGLDKGQKSERRVAHLAEATEALAAARDALASAGDPSAEAALEVRRKVDAAEDALLDFEYSLKNHDIAAKLGLLTIAVIVVWQFLVTKVGPLKPLNVIPAPLLAVLAATVAAWAFILPVVYVEVPASLADEIRFPTWTVLRTMDWQAVLGGGLLIGAVASAESLLCAAAVDKLHKFPKANFDRELFAQGVGNSICGLLGALPMTGVIVRSSANVRSGATSRSSAILHGVWLLIFVALLGWLLALIPTTALAGVLVYVGWRLIDFAAVGELWKLGKGELVVFFVTVAGIVAVDLLSGVVAGIILAAIRLLTKFGKLNAKVEIDESTPPGAPPIVHLRLQGAATFLKLPKLAETLDEIPSNADVRADLTELSYIDHACVDLLAEWRAQHEDTGGTLSVDWDLLEDRFRTAATPAANGIADGNGNDVVTEDEPVTKPI
ncbi:SulP family inorganic anion transporter [Alienimonas chondri]|uniref:SulP family inorganic anion transporter n=1 Tax=Alienimonas chondri TaxID=2681879 RepID=UPI0028F3E39F|nr:SulP family inorganic anion transporter [Alienimonas chondri]